MPLTLPLELPPVTGHGKSRQKDATRYHAETQEHEGPVSCLPSYANEKQEGHQDHQAARSNGDSKQHQDS
jgi:hypothetical protein